MIVNRTIGLMMEFSFRMRECIRKENLVYALSREEIRLG